MLHNYDWPGNVRELANVVERSFYLSLKSKIIRPIDLPDPVAAYQSLQVQRNNYLHTPMDLRQSIYNGYGENIDFMFKLADSQYVVQSHKPRGRILSIKENEELLIRQTLTRSGYNISRTAFLLGISRTTLYRKINRYKIDTKMVF